MAKNSPYKSIVQSRRECIRLADETVPSMIEVDSIISLAKGLWRQEQQEYNDVPECHNSGGEVIASSA